MVSFLRKNFIIVFSVSLPLLVLLVFSIATIVPNWLVAPPAHNVVLIQGAAGWNRNPPIGVDIRIVDGQLEARAVRNSTGYVVVPRLYLFTAATQTTREIPIPFDLGTIEHGDAVPIPELSGFRIDTSMRSPDSWNYQGPNYRVAPGSSAGAAVSTSRGWKDGAIVRMQLPNEAPYYRHNLRFLGWIVE